MRNKNKLRIIIVSLIFVFLTFGTSQIYAQTVKDNFAGWANVLTNPTMFSGNYKFRISGFQGNPKAYDQQYVLTDLTVGDVLWSNTCSRFIVVSRTLDTLVVSDPDPGLSVLPVAGERIGLTREFDFNGSKISTTPQFGDGAGGPILGTTASLGACIAAHNLKVLSAAHEISKYTGSGVPGFTPTGLEPRIAQGLASPYPFYVHNGSAWVLLESGTTETASNGLTKTGNDIRLGGTLTQPTTITATLSNPLQLAGLPQNSNANSTGADHFNFKFLGTGGVGDTLYEIPEQYYLRAGNPVLVPANVPALAGIIANDSLLTMNVVTGVVGKAAIAAIVPQEVNLVSVLPTTAKLGYKATFVQGTDTMMLTKTAASYWQAESFSTYSNNPAIDTTIGGQTITRKYATWKNPTLSTISGQTSDYTYQNGAWKDIKGYVFASQFGAIGNDGVTDYTPLQNAFTYAINNGVKLVIDAMYETDKQIKIQRQGYLKVEGYNSLISGIKYIGTSGGDSAIILAGKSAIPLEISNLYLGNTIKNGTGAKYGFKCDSLEHSIIKNCRFFSLDSAAINFGYGWSNRFSDNLIQNCKNGVVSTNGSNWNDVMFDHNSFLNIDSMCMHIKANGNYAVKIVNCGFENSGTGIFVEGQTHGLSIDNCYFEAIGQKYRSYSLPLSTTTATTTARSIITLNGTGSTTSLSAATPNSGVTITNCIVGQIDSTDVSFILPIAVNGFNISNNRSSTTNCRIMDIIADPTILFLKRVYVGDNTGFSPIQMRLRPTGANKVEINVDSFRVKDADWVISPFDNAPTIIATYSGGNYNVKNTSYSEKIHTIANTASSSVFGVTLNMDSLKYMRNQSVVFEYKVRSSGNISVAKPYIFVRPNDGVGDIFDVTIGNAPILTDSFITRRLYFNTPASGSIIVGIKVDGLTGIEKAMFKDIVLKQLGAITPTIYKNLDWTTDSSFMYNITKSIGIGTSAPTERFQVIGNIQSQGMKIESGATTSLNLYNSIVAANNRNWQFTFPVAVYGDFGIKQSTTNLGDPSTGNTRLYIAPNGNVGIGDNITAASYKLDIDAKTGSTGNPLRLQGLQAGSTTDSIVSDSAGVLRRMSTNDYGLLLQNGNTLATPVRIGSNDNQNVIIERNNDTAAVFSSNELALGKKGIPQRLVMNSGRNNMSYDFQVGSTPNPNGVVADQSLQIGINLTSSPNYKADSSTWKQEFEYHYDARNVSPLEYYDEWYLQHDQGTSRTSKRPIRTIVYRDTLLGIETNMQGKLSVYNSKGDTRLMIVTDTVVGVGLYNTASKNKGTLNVQNILGVTNQDVIRVGSSNSNPSIGFYTDNSANSDTTYARIKMVNTAATVGNQSGDLQFSTIRNNWVGVRLATFGRNVAVGGMTQPLTAFAIRDSNMVSANKTTSLLFEVAGMGGANGDGSYIGWRGVGGTTNLFEAGMDVNGGYNYKINYLSTTNRFNINGATGKTTIDAKASSSTGDPLTLLGLNAGATSDSIISSASGVLKRLSIQQVTAKGMTDSCMTGLTASRSLTTMTGETQTITLPRTVGNYTSYNLQLTPVSDAVGLQSYQVTLGSLNTTQFQYNAYNGTVGSINYQISWRLCPNGY